MVAIDSPGLWIYGTPSVIFTIIAHHMTNTVVILLSLRDQLDGAAISRADSQAQFFQCVHVYRGFVMAARLEGLSPFTNDTITCIEAQPMARNFTCSGIVKIFTVEFLFPSSSAEHKTDYLVALARLGLQFTQCPISHQRLC